MPNNVDEFKWTDQKLDVAKALAKGYKTHLEIAKEFHINNNTITRWKCSPEFMQKVDEYTMAHDLGTKAGLLRGLFHGLQKKAPGIEDDKTTYLDFSKEVAEVLGMKKQKIELDGNLGISKIEISTNKRDPE